MKSVDVILQGYCWSYTILVPRRMEPIKCCPYYIMIELSREEFASLMARVVQINPRREEFVTAIIQKVSSH